MRNNQEKHMIYTVTFNPAIDYIFHTGSFDSEDVIRAKYDEIFIGGKGINVSRVLSALGIESTALGFIAGFTGDAIEAGLTRMGIANEFVRLKSGNTRINMKVKTESGERELNGKGPYIDGDSLNVLCERLDKLTPDDVLVMAGSVPSDMSSDIYAIITERLTKKGIRVIVDATGNLLQKTLKHNPFLIKPNHHELAAMFGVEIKTKDDIITYGRKLKEMGAVNVLISMAGDGAILIDEDDIVHEMGVYEGKIINSVGAGDSMVAGFVAALFGDYSSEFLKAEGYEKALRLGTACGAATAFSEDLATREEIERLLMDGIIIS